MRNLDINQFAAVLQTVKLPRIIKLVEAGIVNESLEIEVLESLGKVNEAKAAKSVISDGHVLLSFLYVLSTQGHATDNIC